MSSDVLVGYFLARIQAQGGIGQSVLQELAKQRFDGLCQIKLNEALISLLWIEDLHFRNQTLLVRRGGVVHTRFAGAVADGFVIGWFDHLDQMGHSVVPAPLLRQPAQQLFQGGEIAIEVYQAVVRLWRHQIAKGYVRGQDPEQYCLSMMARPIPLHLWY